MAPAVAESLGISAGYTGLYVAIVYLGAMLASLAGGGAVARFGAIRVSQGGLVLCALGLALCALPTAASIAVGAFLIGLGYGPITPASSHLLARGTPAHRLSLVFSIKQTGVPLGGALAGAVVPSLMLALGWQGALLAVAAANLACAVAAQPVRAPLDDDRDPKRSLVIANLAQPVRLVLSHPVLRMLAGCSFVFSITQLSFTSYLVTYLHGTLSYTLVAAGFVLALAQFGGVAGRVLWGWAADRGWGARRTLAGLGLLMGASASATALLQPGWPLGLVVAILVVFGGSAIGWNGVYLAEVARRAPTGQAGLATGGTLAVTFFGVVLGPPVFGALSSFFGSYRAGFAALALATCCCAWVLLRAGGSIVREPV
ncbi:MFS transporter [Ramlibacter sp. AN1015]|uniref:MFS transporter n=1 Tax=Ramlibacter sp. AN1015 TaxID=3133428 RepID=UPI0030C39B82